MINATLDLHGCICGAVVQIMCSTAANLETIYIKTKYFWRKVVSGINDYSWYMGGWFVCVRALMHYNFGVFCPRVTSEFLCCSVVCDDVMLVPAAAADGLPGRASSPNEEISWTLRFPLPLSSHNILPLIQFTAIHIRKGGGGKTGCRNILWGFWHDPTSASLLRARNTPVPGFISVLSNLRAAGTSTEDGRQRDPSTEGHSRERPGGQDGAVVQQTTAPLCQDGAQNTWGNRFLEVDARIRVRGFILIYPHLFPDCYCDFWLCGVPDGLSAVHWNCGDIFQHLHSPLARTSGT